MRAALAEAEAALAAGEFPVGCVFVRQGEIVSRGRRINSKGEAGNELDHAEIVGLRSLVAENPGLDLAEVRIYSTMEPCLMCYATLILSGVRTIVYSCEDVMGGSTGLDLARLNPLYREMEVKIVPHILRRDSLDIFQTFFRNPENTYWQDSPLARHILAQK